ncbi:hypothetical protein [Maribacter sp. HTCC2170]|uniref:DUF7486 family protein n=1 Tax=Maribacter sp. (strain HTCC2170 / KCCM 42371) TaxID=313603 RepID=UPI00006AFDA2|nr:hypothetical protein [Maribacter sp. HTCC2170]EAR01389.1 hypothetical protein FB2170_11731 [Maribacter sp. HTCC2170]
MKTSNQPFIGTIGHYVFILGFLFLATSCNDGPKKDKTSKTETEEIATVNDIYWNVKAIHPDGKSLAIKAFDNEGKSFDIKAIQNSDQDSFLDVKAIVDGKQLPVKMLESENQFVPVAAINNEGTKYYVKAITAEGEKLDVKGVARFGNIVIVKAITKKGDSYGVKAVSPTGQLNDIKGIKIARGEREMVLKGIGIHAHVKAMHPAANEDDFRISTKKKKKTEYKSDFERIIWNIKAVTADGQNLDVKAFDAEGNTFDVKATQDSKQHSFMNIKAIVEGAELPVKIMESSDEYAPVNAIGRNGVIYEIKAITNDDVKLDVKGISRSGNIINVKAINVHGEFYGVKAFAPDGKLNQVKGIKIFDRKVEMNVQGHPVYAHLKAISQ